MLVAGTLDVSTVVVEVPRPPPPPPRQVSVPFIDSFCSVDEAPLYKIKETNSYVYKKTS
jgi:hypothetical protein